MSREKYCKFCGRELDKGKCICEAFLNSQKNEKKPRREQSFIVCDTCGTKVESDANYCINCGLPIHANGNIEKLQKELQGIGAPDVIEVYTGKTIKQRQQDKHSFPLVAMIALSTFVFGVAIGLVIKPRFDSFIRNKMIQNNLSEETLIETTSTIIDSTTTINGPTAQEEILSPTAGTKKENQNKEIETQSNEDITNTDKMEHNNIETEEGKESTNETENSKKNLIDKTTKTETVTIKMESETSIPETTSITDVEINGKIKGVSTDTKTVPDLYIQSLRSIKDTVTKDGETCEISYFAPVIAGKDTEEAKIANAAYTYAFNLDFHEILTKRAISSSELPLSIVFTEVEQRNITKNRLFIITYGKITPRSGLTIKVRYRALYDRRDHTVKFEIIE